MRHVVTGTLVAIGLLHLYPAVGVLGAARLESMYGVAVDSAAVELLLRHRAATFGLLGALLLAAAWHRPLRALALVAGLASMGSFVALAWPVQALGPALARVFWADVAGLVLLVGAVVAMRTATRRAASRGRAQTPRADGGPAAPRGASPAEPRHPRATAVRPPPDR